VAPMTSTLGISNLGMLGESFDNVMRVVNGALLLCVNDNKTMIART
jgi:hypothetical protein